MRVVSLESPLKGHQPLYVLNFLCLILNFWVLSRFMQKCLQPSACSDHGLYRILSSYIGWRTFIWWKNPQKCSSILVRIAEWWNSLLTSRNPKNNWYLSRIFGTRFGEKDRGLSTCKPWTEQAGGLEAGLRIHIHFIRIQLFRLNTNPDPIRIQSGSRALMTKNWKKIAAEIFYFFFFKNCNLPIPRPQ